MSILDGPADGVDLTANPNDDLMTDGQDASEAVKDTETLEQLIAATEPAKEGEEKAPVIDPLEEMAARLTALVKPVHELSTHTKVLLYGEQGSSKTTSSMRAPAPLLVAIEAGSKSLLNHAETNNLPVMEFKSVKQIEDLAYVMRIGRWGDEYETIVLDTFSELEKTVVSNRVREEYAKNRFTRDQYTPEGKDYQSSGEHMRQIAAAFRDVPKNVIFVCQEDIKDGVYRPALPNKVLAKLGEYCDVVGRFTADWTDTENPKFTLQCRRTPGVLAKSRIKILPTMFENADFDLIHRANMKQIRDAQEKK